MPAIRVVMPNGTTRSFPEATPKRVIRQAEADMIAEMKASPVYEGFDVTQWEPKRKVTVTQTGAGNQAPRHVTPNPLGATPSDEPDEELLSLERDAREQYGLTQDELDRMHREAVGTALAAEGVDQALQATIIGRLGKTAIGASRLVRGGLNASEVADIVNLPNEIGQSIRSIYMNRIGKVMSPVNKERAYEEEKRRGMWVSAGDLEYYDPQGPGGY